MGDKQGMGPSRQDAESLKANPSTDIITGPCGAKYCRNQLGERHRVDYEGSRGCLKLSLDQDMGALERTALQGAVKTGHKLGPVQH